MRQSNIFIINLFRFLFSKIKCQWSNGAPNKQPTVSICLYEMLNLNLNLKKKIINIQISYYCQHHIHIIFVPNSEWSFLFKLQIEIQTVHNIPFQSKLPLHNSMVTLKSNHTHTHAQLACFICQLFDQSFHTDSNESIILFKFRNSTIIWFHYYYDRNNERTGIDDKWMDKE